MFRIIDLTLHNFKGFKDTVISFEKPRTILGGPNGYGKTSIFDALELLFTGTIQRMQVYRPGHDDRTNLRDEYKPLVYDTSIDEIIIEANVQLDEHNIVRLKRSAEQGRMKNPVDFNAFTSLQFYNQGTSTFEDVETNEFYSNVFTSLKNQYTFLNYLTQEEANQFLKCREIERKQQINSLFQTQGFDEPLNRLTGIRNVVKEMAQAINGEITRLKQDIERLQSTPASSATDDTEVEYLRLFDREFDWDKENPQLSYESFNNLLSTDGMLDQLRYYCQNASAYHWFELNERMSQIQNADNLNKLAFWLKWSDKEGHLVQFDNYTRNFRKKWEELNLSSIHSFSLEIPSLLPETVVSQKVLGHLNEQIATIREAAKSTGSLQRAFADLVGSRNMTEKTLSEVQKTVHLTQCPLCGTQHENETELVKSVQSFGKEFNESLNQITKGVATSVDQLKAMIGESVIKPIDTYYQELGLTSEVLTSYQSVDKETLQAQLSFLISNHIISDEVSDSVNDIEYIAYSIEAWRKANPMNLPAEFDVQRLRRVHSSYGRYLIPEQINVESIENKRQYLTKRWNTSTSQLLAEKTGNMGKLQAQYDKLNKRQRLIKQTIDKIKIQKNAYLSKMVSQIETLFYIYTGRVMQDNYYGRGCFLKYNQNNSNVLFTSGSPDNEVDALYKMSSGQLVSISVAFMLTVNKLYANHPFIAIDDPVQTIDDLNLWGLMETLRHDFRDNTVLLSTHERDFGLLLTDKFNKVGLNTEYVDMSQHH